MASGGWGGNSEFGAIPRAFTLTRIVNGETNVWKIQFNQMEHDRWRGFSFREGDHIHVHTLFL